MLQEWVQMGNERMTYYAHSENERGKKHCLSEHLKRASDIAASFGNNDVTRAWFKIAGLLHDFGKYQPDFQKYLIEGGRRGSVPHAIWGAGYARILGLDEISFVIDGHHKGIPNKSDLKTDTEEFKRKEIKEFDSILKTFLRDNALSESKLKLTVLAFQSSVQKRELFIRYLFSALTDADWLDTESHFKPELPQYRASKTLPIDEMIRKLEKEILSKSKEGEINKLRNQSREEAIKKTDMPCGFYSLNLPTGMGKTLISLDWALRHAKTNSLKRILIVLPYINIIDQTATILKNIFGEDLVLEHHSAYNENEIENKDDENESDVLKKQKRLACENWDYPVIVTTTVQFFESLFSNKPSKCRKIHNIAEAVVIFDEVQAFPKEILMPTLSMLKNVQEVMRTSFLFCTATQPAFEKREKFNGIETITPLVNNPSEIFNKTRRVTYHLLKNLEPIKLADLLQTASEANCSILTIFNTKKAARNFFETVQNSNCWEKSYHLSTTMCPVNRRQVIKNIRCDLENKRKIIVSSTQLIEAGVDFDFPCVMRAIAPLESIIQSAGRCNRENTLPEYGKVYLFQLEESGMPDKTYQACAEHAKNLIQYDIYSLYRHDFFQEYYSQVVNLFIDPDKNKIIAAQENFNFGIVNDSYRVIRKETEGLFVYYYNEESKRLINSIENKPFLTRDEYRELQPYTVQVYQNFIDSNSNNCHLLPQGIRVWYGNYDHNTGISVDPVSADKSIV